MSTSISDDSMKIKNIASFATIGVIILWALTFLLLLLPEDKQGIFGDMFGAVNALFSGLAFAGLIITLILQRHELALQRDELEQTRKEFVEQNKTMKRQRFENTFFNLMSLQQHITDNLEFSNPDGADSFEARGRDVFKKFYLEKDNFDGTNGIKGYLKKKSAERFLRYKHIEVFNHYFHFFDGILKYIDTSDLIEKKERYQYAVMLRNSLSDSERYMMFYYYASSGTWHKVMAEEYSLFYDVNRNELANDAHYSLFAPTAYNYDPAGQQ